MGFEPLGGWCQTAWAAFRAPRGELQDGATHGGVGSPRSRANATDHPTPPEPEGRVGVAVELCVVSSSPAGRAVEMPPPPLRRLTAIV